MNRVLIAVLSAVIIFFVIRSHFGVSSPPEEPALPETKSLREISGTVKEGETLYDIFKRYNLDLNELLRLKEASADVHRLKKLYPGQPYKFLIDNDSNISSFSYWINDENILHITRTESGFCAEKKTIEYEKRLLSKGGIIQNNLMESIGEGRQNLLLALELSDIFAWDIDFTTDLRNGDIFKIIVEGFYLDGEFKKFGKILSSEFVNDGKVFHAYRFEQNGELIYFDDEGKSLKRSFLKAPLSFRRISSHFSYKRFHPILRIYRPHHGLDYAAPRGTPVVSVGDGTVVSAGYRGNYGKLVIMRHPNGWKTYYGHLTKIAKGIRKGKKIQQGQIIGYVGSTGLATGPHLHYEVRIHNKPTNPLKLKIPRGKSISDTLLADFKSFKNRMDKYFASNQFPQVASTETYEKNLP